MMNYFIAKNESNTYADAKREARETAKHLKQVKKKYQGLLKNIQQFKLSLIETKTKFHY